MSDKAIIVGTIDHSSTRMAALLDAIVKQNVIFVGADMAANDGATTFARAKLVDGEVKYEIIGEEDFYGQPVETIIRDELRERWLGTEPIELLPVPDLPLEQIYSLQKQQREDIDRLLRLPPIERTHPTSPRKTRK